MLIAAHGNSIRGMLKMLDSIADEDIVGLEIPTGVPRVRPRPRHTATHRDTRPDVP